ncbi:hypothetical protein CC78DRAFT_590306, partial [Lojkania enalia]
MPHNSRHQETCSSSPPKKKYQRSQSPRAKERRKIQNRIAQRNHRRRLKEQSVSSSEDCTDLYDSLELFTIPPHQFEGLDSLENIMTPTDTMISDDMSLNSAPAWAPVDSNLGFTVDPSLAQFPEAGSYPSDSTPFVFPFLDGCTCSAMTGPCARHLEEIKFQMSLSAPPPSNNQLASPTLSTVDFDGGSPSPFSLDGSNTPYMMNSKRGPPHRHRSNTSVSTTSTPSSLCSASEPASMPATEYSTLIPRDHPAFPNPTGPDDAARNTDRFTKLLSAVRVAGFADFDSMVSTYYTCTFEKGSMSDMAQRASRSRRLGRLLQNLHASSCTWSRWEAKGFQASSVENAKAILLNEMKKVSRHVKVDEDALSALHALRTSSGEIDRIEENRLMALLTTFTDHVETAVPDDAPHLWSLFTELAGPQSLYCDRVTQAVLALLINGRCSQWHH